MIFNNKAQPAGLRIATGTPLTRGTAMFAVLAAGSLVQAAHAQTADPSGTMEPPADAHSSAPDARDAVQTPQRAEATSQAPGGIEDIIVTANKRPENVQKVAAAISAFSGAQLEANNITNLTDIARITPGLQVYSSINARNTTVAIRNFGTGGTNPGLESDVGIFLDGIYLPTAATTLNNLTDIATVEVLRGPQGTLAGRNTPVGEVVVTTRAPTKEFEARIEGELGNFDHRKVAGYIGGGLTSNVAARLSFWSDTHSGYIKNTQTNTYVQTGDNWGVRGRLRWEPDDQTTVDFIGAYTRLKYDGFFAADIDPFGLGGVVGRIGTPQSSYGPNSTYDFQTSWNALYPDARLRFPGKFETEGDTTGLGNTTTTYGGSVEVDRDLGFATLSNIFGYNVVDDKTRPATNTLPVNALPGYRNSTQWTSISDELRIVSTGSHFIDYVAGLYYYHQDLDFLIEAPVGRAANLSVAGLTLTPGQTGVNDLHVKTSSIAGYGQLTANFTPSFRVTVGGRYSHDRKRGVFAAFNREPDGSLCAGAVGSQPSCTLVNLVFAPLSYDQSLSENELTGMATVQYDLAPRVMVYATAANGFKNGGFVTQRQSLAAEKSENYEIGLKSTFFDNRLLFNVDVFRMIIKDLQQSSLAPGATSYFYQNAGRIGQYGVEADLRFNPTKSLSLTGSLAYIDAKFDSYPNAPCVTGYPYAGAPVPAGSPPRNTSGPFVGACDQTGFTPPNSPKWTWSTGARYQHDLAGTSLQGFVQGNVHGSSGQYLATPSLDPRSYQSAYVLVDANVGVQSADERWKIQIYARNLTNRGYFQAITNMGAAGVYRVGGQAPNGYMGYWGTPRTFGVQGSYKF